MDKDIQNRVALNNLLGVFNYYLAWKANDSAKKTECLFESIKQFEEAVKLLSTEDGWPLELSILQNNYGITCAQMAVIAKQKEYCEKSSELFDNALKTMKNGVFPLRYTLTRYNAINANELFTASQQKNQEEELALSDNLSNYDNYYQQMKRQQFFFHFIYLLG